MLSLHGVPRWLSRAVFLLSFPLFPLPASAQNALILIQHDRAGPNLPSADYVFAEWIRWPVDQPGLNNRILSLASGVDLLGERDDMGFDEAGADRRKARNGLRLQRRGFFEARDRYRGSVETTVVENPRGAISPTVLLLALDAPDRAVTIEPFGAPLPSSGLVVYEALGWDDARAIAARASGRTLIVEYPPEGDEGWSRYWLRGHWPTGVPTESGLGVPGLVRARSALALLQRPSAFLWSATDAGRWGGPNRWLEHGSEDSPYVLLGWFLVATFVVAWAMAQVMNEDRGPFVAEMLVLTALSPAALVFAGAAARQIGLDAWPIMLVLAFALLYGASLLLGMAARRWADGSHPLWPASLVGLATMALFDPLWSDLSGRFAGVDVAVSSYALGAFVAYLSGAVAFAPGRSFGRILAAATLVWGATALPWWIGGHSAFLILPLVVLLAAEGLFRPAFLLVVAFLPTGLVHLVREGVAWSPNGLVKFADERNATNLWQHAAFLISPQWIGLLGFAASVALVGNRFLAYRLGKLLRLDPRLRALPWVALSTLALGVTEPLALPAAPVVVLGALVALAYDGLRANA